MPKELHPASDARLITRRVRDALIKTYAADSTVSESQTELLLDIADPTSPTGHRSFVIDVREIDRPEDGLVEFVVMDEHPPTGTNASASVLAALGRHDRDHGIPGIVPGLHGGVSVVNADRAPSVTDWAGHKRSTSEQPLTDEEGRVLDWLRSPSVTPATSDVIGEYTGLSHRQTIDALRVLQERHGLVDYDASTGWVAVR